MGWDNQAMFERTTKFYAESATEWQLKLIVWEFFCTLTWSGRARNCVRKRRTHVTRWLRVFGADGSASGCTSIGAVGIRDSLGTRRDRRVATLSYFDFTIPGAIDQSEYMFCDGKHMEADVDVEVCLVRMGNGNVQDQFSAAVQLA